VKKQYKILAGIIGLIIALLFVAWLYKADIIKTVLINTVERNSKGKIELLIKNIDYNPFSRNISIIGLGLHFSINDSLKQNKTMLKQLSFDKVEISGFELFKLIIHKEIKTDSIITTKPDLVFTQTESKTDIRTPLHKHFKSVSREKIGVNTLPIEINVLKLEYGNIVFQSDSNTSLGSANFYVELHDFNSARDTVEFDSHSFFFSKQLLVDISKFEKPLKNNANLNIENIRFDSKKDRIEVSDLQLLNPRGENHKVPDSLQLNSIIIDGVSISELINDNDLSINSLDINGGYFSFSKSEQKNNKDTIVKGRGLFSIISEIEIEELRILNIDGFYFDENKNLNAELRSFNVTIDSLLIDSTHNFKNKLPIYHDLQIEVDGLGLFEKSKVQTGKLVFSQSKSELQLYKLKVEDSLGGFVFKTDEFIVHKLKLENILKKDLSDIVVEVFNPYLSLYTNSNSVKNNADEPKSPLGEFRIIDELIIHNAEIITSNNKGFSSRINSLDASIEFKKTRISSHSILSLIDALDWKTERISVNDLNAGIVYSSESSSYGQRTLSINEANISSTKLVQSKLQKISFSSMTVTGFDVFDLLANNTLNSDVIVIKSPILNVNYESNESDRGQTKFNLDSLDIDLPWNISIAKIDLINGAYNLIFLFNRINT